MNVYWALRRIKPQDLEVQIQALIDEERAPESEIRATHEVLEDVARQRKKYQPMAARELITFDELGNYVAELNQRKEAAERELERLTSGEQRVERLKIIKASPVFQFLYECENGEGIRRDYYRDMELRVVADRDNTEITGVFGSQFVTPTSTSEPRR